jgi:hypothetical protein
MQTLDQTDCEDEHLGGSAMASILGSERRLHSKCPRSARFCIQLVVRSQMVRERHALNEPTLRLAPTVLVGADERHLSNYLVSRNVV